MIPLLPPPPGLATFDPGFRFGRSTAYCGKQFCRGSCKHRRRAYYLSLAFVVKKFSIVSSFPLSFIQWSRANSQQHFGDKRWQALKSPTGRVKDSTKQSRRRRLWRQKRLQNNPDKPKFNPFTPFLRVEVQFHRTIGRQNGRGVGQKNFVEEISPRWSHRDTPIHLSLGILIVPHSIA